MDKITEAYKAMLNETPVLKEAIGPRQNEKQWHPDPNIVKNGITLKISPQQLKLWSNDIEEAGGLVPEDVADWEEYLFGLITGEIGR
jgi:hypothetical protein